MIKRKRNLQSLFKRIPIAPIGPVPSVRISGISIDSREVQPGMFLRRSKEKTLMVSTISRKRWQLVLLL